VRTTLGFLGVGANTDNKEGPNGSRKLFRFADILGLGSTSSTALAVMGCRSDEGKIGLGVLDMKLFFDMCTQCFLFVVTHDPPPC